MIAGLPAIALMFAVAPSVPPPPRWQLFEPSKPHLLNVREVFRSEDYPRDALKAEQEGEVRLRVIVSPTGDVISCDVVKSAAIESFNRRSCELVRQRAWFVPARDAAGEPVAGSVELPIKWVMEDPSYANVATFNRLTIPIRQDGAMPSCKFEIFVLGEKQREESCTTDAEFQNSRTLWRVVEHVRGRNLISEFHLLSPAHLPRAGEGGGEEILMRTLVEFEVGSDGKPADCRVIEDNTEGFSDVCRMVTGHDMRFGLRAKDKPPRKLRFLAVLYTRP